MGSVLIRRLLQWSRYATSWATCTLDLAQKLGLGVTALQRRDRCASGLRPAPLGSAPQMGGPVTGSDEVSTFRGLSRITHSHRVPPGSRRRSHRARAHRVAYLAANGPERLAALTPSPRINLVLHHGVLAPHSRWRARSVTYGRDVAGRLFEAVLVVRRDGDVGVEVEAVEVGLAGAVDVTQGPRGSRPICNTRAPAR